MKKVIMTVGLVAVAGSVLAGTTITSGTAITSGVCTLIQEDVTPRTSNNVKAGYDCNANGYIGIGTASSAGKEHQYGASNKGGTMTEDVCANPSAGTNAQTCANAAATIAAAS